MRRREKERMGRETEKRILGRRKSMRGDGRKRVEEKDEKDWEERGRAGTVS